VRLAHTIAALAEGSERNASLQLELQEARSLLEALVVQHGGGKGGGRLRPGNALVVHHGRHRTMSGGSEYSISSSASLESGTSSPRRRAEDLTPLALGIGLAAEVVVFEASYT